MKRMEAGIELDAIVAERVFGDKFEYNPIFKDYNRPLKEDPIAFERCPKYSTEIRDAWKVIEKLLVLSPNEDLHIEHWKDEEFSGWQVSTCFVVGEWKDWAKESSLPHAICIAALKALGEA